MTYTHTSSPVRIPPRVVMNAKQVGETEDGMQNRQTPGQTNRHTIVRGGLSSSFFK